MSNSSVWPWTLRSLNPTSPTNTEHEVGSVLHSWDLTPEAIENEAVKTIELTRTAFDAVGSLANSPDDKLSYDAVIKVPLSLNFYSHLRSYFLKYILTYLFMSIVIG